MSRSSAPFKFSDSTISSLHTNAFKWYRLYVYNIAEFSHYLQISVKMNLSRLYALCALLTNERRVSLSQINTMTRIVKRILTGVQQKS
jgi:hypothetical protein